jgi:hypothetical protein
MNFNLTALVICHDEELAASYRSGNSFQIQVKSDGSSLLDLLLNRSRIKMMQSEKLMIAS